MPIFKGCDEGGTEEIRQKCSNSKLIDYMIKEVKYPKIAKSKGVEGKVMVEFTVTEKGGVKDAKVLKGVSSELDAEALRVVKEMPQWTPGQSEGKKVSVSMVLPISFTLPK